MPELSSSLQKARERAGLEIEDISARTKIKPTFLRALESGNYEILPGLFFTRAFLKAYAREVALDPSAVVADFDREHGVVRSVELGEVVKARAAHQQVSPAWRPQHHELTRPGWQIAGAAALVLVVVMLGNREEASDPAPTAQPVATSAAGAASPVGTSGRNETPQTLTINIRPADAVWVVATADGETVVYKLLQPGQNVTVSGRDLAFRVGNAGAFVYSINGVPGRPLGGPGQVRELRITLENFRSYLR